MALRAQFTETVAVPMGVDKDLVPLVGVAATPYICNADGSDGAQVTAYAGRTGSTVGVTLTDAAGKVAFYLDPGEYNIHFDDPASPPRMASFVRGFGSVTFSTAQIVSANQTPPYGLITPYGGSSDPVDPDAVSRWLICNGRSLIRTDYPLLFSVIGTTYGSADSTHFNIPDLRQRFPIGKAAAGTGSTLGGTGGTVDSSRSVVMPAHSHSFPAYNSGAGVELLALTAGGSWGASSYSPTVGADSIPIIGGSGALIEPGIAFVGSSSEGVNGDVDTPIASGTYNPPFIALNYVIKAL